MPSGFKTYSASVQVDLDDLFATRSGTARANTGFIVGSQDLADRYEQTGGGDLIGFNVYYKSGSTDLASLFKSKTYAPTTPTPSPTPTLTPTPTPTLTPTPTPTLTPTPTPTPTPTEVPYPVTAVTFTPSTGQYYNQGNYISVYVTATNGSTPITGYRWYNWNGGAYVTAGVTSQTYNIGTSPAGTPDDLGSYWTYYYAVEIQNAAGWSGTFEWEVNIYKNVLPTYATFSPSAGTSFNDGDTIIITHTGNDGYPSVTGRLWYYWNGSTYVSSGVTTTTYNVGNGSGGTPYKGVPDDMGGGVNRYYYTIRLTNAAGNTDPQNETNFGTYYDVQT